MDNFESLLQEGLEEGYTTEDYEDENQELNN